MRRSQQILFGLLFGTALVAPAMAADDVRARVRIGPSDRPHAVVHVDRSRRVPPDVRVRGIPGRVTVRVNPFRARLGWHVNRFTPGERAAWTHGRWWHGRRNGRNGWWWWANGGWFFYSAPVYPYPDYVSETYYDEPSGDSGDYWYYCRDPQGYYPYVRTCRSNWEPVPAQPGGGYGGGDYGPSGGDQYGPGDSSYGPQGGGQYGPGGGGYGPPGGSMGPGDQGDYGPDEQGGPDDQGPPDGYGPDDQGPPDDGPPPRS